MLLLLLLLTLLLLLSLLLLSILLLSPSSIYLKSTKYKMFAICKWKYNTNGKSYKITKVHLEHSSESAKLNIYIYNIYNSWILFQLN